MSKLDSTQNKLLIEKDARGLWRWTTFTGSSFKDRDGEILTLSALEADCDRLNETGQFGELDWYHCDGMQRPTEKEQRAYIPLGKCDTSFMVGKVNVESGTFYDDRVAEKLAARAKEFGASKLFYHTEPMYDPTTKSGVIDYIETVGRGIMFRGKESNLLTRLFVWRKEKEMADNKERIKAFSEAVGEPLAKEVIESAQLLQQTAEEIRLANKEMTAKAKQDAEDKGDDEAAEGETPKAKAKEAALTAKEIGEGLSLAVKEAVAPLVELQRASLESAKESQQIMQDLSTRLAVAEKSLQRLNGVQPKGFKASEATETATPASPAEILQQFEKAAGMPNDPKSQLNSFINRGIPQ